MRWMPLALAAILVSSPALAQSGQTSSPGVSPSSQPDVSQPPAPKLPVSLDKIRGALERPPPPGQLLRGVDEKPTFRIEIFERQRIEELLATLDFKSGPTPPGGVYGYEQQRVLFPSVDHPFAQPYAAFSQGELLTILFENAIGKYLVDRAGSSIKKAIHERSEATVRREVDEAIAEYCASKPDGGAGIQLCESIPESR
jgi:hypothetical protein